MAAAIHAAATWAHRDAGTSHVVFFGIVHGGSGNCAPSKAEVAKADDLVARTTLALHHYRDPHTALAEGFEPLGFEPNGVAHYLNRSFQEDSAVLDPTKPESIVYGRLSSGDLRPIGVMYMMPTKGVDGPRPGGCLMVWHTHGFPFARPGEESVQMVHVWTIPVPGGPFAHESGPDYARIYLRRTPVPADEINRLLLGYLKPDGTIRDLTGPERLAAFQLATKQDTKGASTDHQSMTALGVSMNLQAQLCDPFFATPVPGAEGRGGLRALLGGAFRRGT